jgi:hypothetical protein
MYIQLMFEMNPMLKVLLVGLHLVDVWLCLELVLVDL